MTKTFSREAIAAARAEIEKDRIDREAETILALIEDLGDDDNPHGTVLRFTKTFVGSPQSYTYAAVKVVAEGNARQPEFWTLTGDTTRYTWDEFVMWLVTEGLPVLAEDVEVVYPEGYEPPAKHVHGPECYGFPADADSLRVALFGTVPAPAQAEETDEELSTSDIVLTSTGEQAADEVDDAPQDEDEDDTTEINGDRVEDVTRD